MVDVLATLCLSILAVFPAERFPDHNRAFHECYLVGVEAAKNEAPVEVALSLAYHESNFDPGVVSPSGARGSLQVIPRWHCPGYRTCKRELGWRACLEECDFRASGIDALNAFLLKHRKGEGAPRFSDPQLQKALCGYIGCEVDGPERHLQTNKARIAFVRSIIRHARWFERMNACRCSAPKDYRALTNTRTRLNR